MTDLAELGLSSYEVKVYRALLTLGSATATEIAINSEVPKGRIYDVLNSLDGRGLVRTFSNREPARYAPVDPDRAIDRLLAERKRELDAQRERYEAIADAVSSELSGTVPTESRFWTAPLGSEEMVTLGEEQFEITDNRITSVISTPYENAHWEAYGEEIAAIDRLLDSSIDVEALLSRALFERMPSDVREDLLYSPESVSVRVTSELQITLDVVDHETVYVHVPDPFDPAERLGVVALRDEDFASDLEAAFEEAWAAATPVQRV